MKPSGFESQQLVAAFNEHGELELGLKEHGAAVKLSAIEVNVFGMWLIQGVDTALAAASLMAAHMRKHGFEPPAPKEPKHKPGAGNGPGAKRRKGRKQ